MFYNYTMLWVWGYDRSSVPFSSHYFRRTCYGMIIAIDVDLHQLTQAFLSGFSTVKLLLCYFSFQKKVTVHSTHLVGGKYCAFLSRVYKNYQDLFGVRILSTVLYFFNHLYMSILCHLCNFSNSSNDREVFHLASMSFGTHPLLQIFF